MKTRGSDRASTTTPPIEATPSPETPAPKSLRRPDLDEGAAQLRGLGRDRPPVARSALPGLPRLRARPDAAGGLEPEAKSLLRRARDENIDALMARFALNLVNGGEGHFARLNPEGLTILRRGRPMRSVEQRYEIIDTVCDLLRVGVSRARIRALVDEAAAEAGADEPDVRAGQALERFVVEARQTVQDRVAFISALEGPGDAGPDDVDRIASRLARVRWVQAELSAALDAPPLHDSYDAELTQLLAHPRLETALEILDGRFETVMEAALGAAVSSGGLRHLESVKYERLPAEAEVRPRAQVEAEALPANHPHYVLLTQLHDRLARGERSAIGGADYARQRLPTEVLEDVVSGTTRAVVYNGTRERALEYVLDRYGRTLDDGREGARVMGLQGLDGSGTRLLVTLDDGDRFLVLAGLGQARQLHNAGAVLLYENEAGERVDVAQLDLATDDADLVARMRADLEGALAQEWRKARGRQVLGHRLQDPKAIPTQLVVVQNPGHLGRHYGDKFAWGTRPKDALFPFSLAYAETDAGLTRLVVPKVGGPGLYGDTAGDFARAFFTAQMGPTNPNLLFNGTAGGFADTAQAFAAEQLRGLGDVRPGGLIMPVTGLEAYGEDAGLIPMLTFLGPEPADWPARMQTFLEQGTVSVTDRHVAVPAPAVETYEMIEEFVGRGHASVDVEGGAILKAMHELRADRPELTFTPIYTHSDDPRMSRYDPFDSLAMMGPLFEGTTFDADLYDLVFTLIGLTQPEPEVEAPAEGADEGPKA